MSQPRAIQTRYDGHHFRSRLEARWAVFLNAAGIRWEYEKQGYELPSGRYLPDFWLPDIDGGCWLEIKGTTATPGELVKACELADATGYPVLIADAGLKPTSGTWDACTLALGRDPEGELYLYPRTDWFAEHGARDHAYAAARTARFEFGETPSLRSTREGAPVPDQSFAVADAALVVDQLIAAGATMAELRTSEARIEVQHVAKNGAAR